MTDPNKDALREAVGNIMRMARGASGPALELLADRICALPPIALLDEVEGGLSLIANGREVRRGDHTEMEDVDDPSAVASRLLAKIQQARGDRG